LFEEIGERLMTQVQVEVEVEVEVMNRSTGAQCESVVRERDVSSFLWQRCSGR
jgi:hypothetical protein